MRNEHFPPGRTAQNGQTAGCSQVSHCRGQQMSPPGKPELCACSKAFVSRQGQMMFTDCCLPARMPCTRPDVGRKNHRSGSPVAMETINWKSPEVKLQTASTQCSALTKILIARTSNLPSPTELVACTRTAVGICLGNAGHASRLAKSEFWTLSPGKAVKRDVANCSLPRIGPGKS